MWSRSVGVEAGGDAGDGQGLVYQVVTYAVGIRGFLIEEGDVAVRLQSHRRVGGIRIREYLNPFRKRTETAAGEHERQTDCAKEVCNTCVPFLRLIITSSTQT